VPHAAFQPIEIDGVADTRLYGQHRLPGILAQGFAAALSALQIARHGATCTKNE